MHACGQIPASQLSYMGRYPLLIDSYLQHCQINNYLKLRHIGHKSESTMMAD